MTTEDTPEEPGTPVPDPTPKPPPRPGRISVLCETCGKKGKLTDSRWEHIDPPEDGHEFLPYNAGTE